MPVISWEKAEVDFKKPTLIEIFTEIFLVKESFLPERFFDVVPKLKEMGLTKVEMDQPFLFQLTQAPSEAKEQEFVAGPSPRVKCWNEEKKRLVQMAKDMFVINLVGEYPGWEEYVALLRKTVDAVKSVGVDIRCKSITLNTIDQFKVPRTGFTVGKYLNAGGSKVPAWYSDVKDSCDISLGMGFLEKDGYNNRLAIRVRAAADDVEIHMTSGFQALLRDGDELFSLLDKLHRQSTDSFKSIVTEATVNEVMGGPKT